MRFINLKFRSTLAHFGNNCQLNSTRYGIRRLQLASSGANLSSTNTSLQSTTSDNESSAATVFSHYGSSGTGCTYLRGNLSIGVGNRGSTPLINPNVLRGLSTWNKGYLVHVHTFVSDAQSTTDSDSEYQPQTEEVIKLRGLPWTADVGNILQFLGRNVNVANGEEGIHILTTGDRGLSRGEAFVDVMAREDLEEALKKHRQEMGSRYIEVFRVKRVEMEWALKNTTTTDNYRNKGNFNDRSDESNVTGFSTNSGYIESASFVKIRGFPFHCTEEDIRQFFTGLEILPNGIEIIDDGSGLKNQAYVQFTSTADARKAMERHKLYMGDRYIEVFRVGNTDLRNIGKMPSGKGSAQREYLSSPGEYDERRDQGTSESDADVRGFLGRRARLEDDNFDGKSTDVGQDTPEGNNNLSVTAPLISNPNSSYNPPDPNPDAVALSANFDKTNWLRMRGLPFESSELDIAEFFKPVVPLSIKIIVNSRKGVLRSSGKADVSFASAEDLNLAMTKHKNQMGHRYVELFANGLQNMYS